jgi:hypothetical protein
MSQTRHVPLSHLVGLRPNGLGELPTVNYVGKGLVNDREFLKGSKSTGELLVKILFSRFIGKPLCLSFTRIDRGMAATKYSCWYSNERCTEPHSTC